MRKLLEAIKQRPLTIHEACAVSKNQISKRMVENYLAELKALGLVIYDPEAKVYKSADLEKRVFGSRHDYELALKHSRALVENADIHYVLDRLLFIDDLDSVSSIFVDEKCLLQHLKTGYYSEFYRSAIAYRVFTEKLSGRRGLRASLMLENQLDAIRPGTRGKVGDLYSRLTKKMSQLSDDPRNGIPLRGYCDHCPERRVKIQDEGHSYQHVEF